MNIKPDTFGVRAIVQIKFGGTMRQLTGIISKGLMLPDFWFDTGQDPPHDEFAMCDCLGSELWLHSSSKVPDYGFEIKMESSHCLDAIMNDRMHDLSPWLSRYLSDICELECHIVGETRAS